MKMQTSQYLQPIYTEESERENASPASTGCLMNQEE